MNCPLVDHARKVKDSKKTAKLVPVMVELIYDMMRDLNCQEAVGDFDSLSKTAKAKLDKRMSDWNKRCNRLQIQLEDI